MRPSNHFFLKALFGLCLLTTLSNCQDKGTDHFAYEAYNPEFNQYITAFTDFEISRTTPIMVRFVDDLATDEQVGQSVKEGILHSEPHLEGEYRWLDQKTIEFKPTTKLKTNTGYSFFVQLDQLFPHVSDGLETFKFSVATKKQYFRLMSKGLIPSGSDDVGSQSFIGDIFTEDFEEIEIVQNSLTALHNNQEQTITWSAPQNGNTVFPFEIKNINRLQAESQLELIVSKEKLTHPDLDREVFKVPSLGSFEMIGHRVVSSPDKYLELTYTDPLDPKQKLDGIITIEDTKFTSLIESNTIKVFPRNVSSGSYSVKIGSGIKNILGSKINASTTLSIAFTEEKPEIKLLDNGTIIPSAESLPFPFEAVNLSAVDLRIIKIKERNIPQFLQVNQLEGSYQLKRVGEVIAKKTIQLDQKLNLKVWNKHVIDLKNIIAPEPGAIYRIALGFKSNQSLYSCLESDTTEGKQMLNLESNWDLLDDDRNRSYRYYPWTERQNPCKPAYFNSDRVVEKNVLGSNMGLIAKRGTNDDFFFAVTDLKTTNPNEGVTLEIYNYQHTLIGTHKTNAKGIVETRIEGRPYLLVAKKGNERGYLRLDNGTSLSLSNFDVNGYTYHQGIKGKIYGERGVWRPGDDIYLTFVMEDKEKSLPVGHPISIELTNPKGQTIHTETSKRGLNGFYHFKLSTKPDDPTGNYYATVRAGGATFGTTIKVETIQPNRLKIKFDIPDDVIYEGKNQLAKMEVKWLHGAKAKNLKTDVAVALSPMTTEFEGYKDYVFDYDRYSYYQDRQVIFDEHLDQNGKADVPLRLETNEDVPGKMRAWFSLKVFEPGGNFSVDAFSTTYHPFKTYVGIKPPARGENSYYYHTDKTHKIDVALVDSDGKPHPKPSKVDVQVYKIDWRWWWDNDSDRLSYYSRNSQNLHQKTTLTAIDGQASFDFKAIHDKWGRYLIIATNEYGHKSSKIIYVDWPGYNRTPDQGEDGAKKLTFTASQDTYTIGDQIQLTVPTPKVGKLLLTIESGNKVLSSQWINASGLEKTLVTLDATAEMAPSCYAYICLIQPQGSFQNDLPIRMYGVIPLNIENPNSRLNPEIKMDDVLAPLTTVEVGIKESMGKPMTYTIAMVDEGLLDLTRYSTPDLWTEFNQRQSLQVKTWDCFDEVVSGQFDKAGNLLSVGGDGEAAKEESAKKAKRFKPVVYYAGPFYLPAGKTKTHRIQMPNYIGSVKTMVIAGQDAAYGNAEKVTPVRKPLMVLGTLPRVVSPNEQIKFPVTVFAMEKHIKNVSLSLQQNGMFKNMGKQTIEVNFKETGEAIAYFDLKAANRMGIARLTVIATSGQEKSTFDIEMDVRPPNPMTSESVNAQIPQGKSTTANIDFYGIEGSNTVTVELSSTPPIHLEDRLDYLIKYPYGCIEQTTSSVFPQVYLSKVMKLKNAKKTEIETNVKAGIARLSSFQTSDGGFAYWPGQSSADAWGSNYAGHFLLEAKNAGYYVPHNLFQNWKNYQIQEAVGFEEFGYRWQVTVQAYRLYTLAAAGAPQMSSMNKLKSKRLNTTSSWYLASAYYLAGQKNIAKGIVDKLPTQVEDYRELSRTYGSSTRDRAIILEVMTLMKDNQQAAKMAIELSKELSSTRWMSTQTTAYSLIAMAKYMTAYPSPNGILAEIIVNGQKQNVATQDNLFSVTLDNAKAKNKITIENKSNGSLYSRIINKGVPTLSTESDGENLMGLEVAYYDLNGSQITAESIAQGTDFKMVVKVHNRSQLYLEEVVLNTMMPSGWEIINSRMTGISTGTNSDYSYQDVKDDRVYTFFDIRAGRTMTYTFMLNAAYLGTFDQPTINTYPMYDESIYARKKGRKVYVVAETDQ